QPLLRNFHTDSLRYQINVTKTNRLISDVQFRQTVTNTVASVKNAYYDLLYAIDNLEAQRSSLALAGRLLEENRIRVRVGTIARLTEGFAKNQTLPQLDLVAGYGTTGIGGTLLQRDGLGGPIISSTPGGLGDAFSSVFGRDFPTWSIGVNVGYSLFNRSARAA